MRNFYYLVNDNVVMEEEDFMDKVYELAENRLGLVVFFFDWFDLSASGANAMANFSQKNNFDIYDTLDFQEWEQEAVEQFIQDETEFYSIDTNGDVYWLIEDDFIIGDWEQIHDELFDRWYDFDSYMANEHPDVEDEEERESYRDEYEKWESGNISAYIADHAKKI